MFEAKLITNTVAKMLWVFCYLLVYGVRPVLVRPKNVGAHIILVCFSFRTELLVTLPRALLACMFCVVCGLAI